MPGYLLDPSVWIAWFFQPHPLNTLATVLLEARSGSDPAWRCRATEQPCLRLATTNTVCRAYSSSVLTNVQVTAAPSTWYAQSHVRCLDAEPGGTPALWLELAPIPPASPKVWMDAYLAAFAISGGLDFVTLDRDFQTYEAHGLRLRLLVTPSTP